MNTPANELLEEITAELAKWGIHRMPAILVGDEPMVLNMLQQPDISAVTIDDEGGIVVEFPEDDNHISSARIVS
jgi:UPF0288 family protein (methanogenesis marker protein 3)